MLFHFTIRFLYLISRKRRSPQNRIRTNSIYFLTRRFSTMRFVQNGMMVHRRFPWNKRWNLTVNAVDSIVLFSFPRTFPRSSIIFFLVFIFYLRLIVRDILTGNCMNWSFRMMAFWLAVRRGVPLVVLSMQSNDHAIGRRRSNVTTNEMPPLEERTDGTANEMPKLCHREIHRRHHYNCIIINH